MYTSRKENQAFYKQYLYLFCVDIDNLSKENNYLAYECRERGYAKAWLSAYNFALSQKLDRKIYPAFIKEIQNQAMAHHPIRKGYFKDEDNHFPLFLQKHYVHNVLTNLVRNPNATLEGFNQLIRNWFYDEKKPTHLIHFVGNTQDVLFYCTAQFHFLYQNKTGEVLKHEVFEKSVWDKVLSKVGVLFRAYNFYCIVNACPSDFITDSSIEQFVEDRVNTLCGQYNEAIVKAVEPLQKIRVIARYMQQLLQLHPFADGNIRTSYILLNRLLVEEGLSMTLLINPNRIYSFDEEELVLSIQEGQGYFSEFKAGRLASFRDKYTLVPSFIESNTLENSEEEIEKFTSLVLSEKCTLTPEQGLLFFEVFPKKLLTRYELTDDTQPTLERGLRMAAANNKIEDLKIFIHFVKNINAKDNNPKRGKTALHLAAERNHLACYHLLKTHGADETLLDAEGNEAKLAHADEVILFDKR